jgi:hypothetical protein
MFYRVGGQNVWRFPIVVHHFVRYLGFSYQNADKPVAGEGTLPISL